MKQMKVNHNISTSSKSSIEEILIIDEVMDIFLSNEDYRQSDMIRPRIHLSFDRVTDIIIGIKFTSV